MSPTEYDNVAILFRASGLGEVEESDFYPRPDEHRRPYRLVILKRTLEASHASAIAADWIRMAIKTGAYFTMNVHTDVTVYFQMFVSRDLAADECKAVA